jgi:flagellar motor component MotA
MDEVDRALDATLTSMQSADAGGASGLRTVARGASGLGVLAALR